MTSSRRSAKLLGLSPQAAVPGARVDVHLSRFEPSRYPFPDVRIGGEPARVVFASERAIGVIVPTNVSLSPAAVTVDGFDDVAELHVGLPFVSELHQVDNPVFDADGNLYVTDSGMRGHRVPVSLFRVRPDGTREPFVSGIVNATSLAIGPDGRLYVSSRFDGRVYRVDGEGHAVPIGSDLGVASGLAFASDGTLFVGDRSGTVLRLDPATGAVTVHASLPPSVAAFHLASGDDDSLFVAGPTLASRDVVYRVQRDGAVSVISSTFGRPQGLAFHGGALYVTEAAAGWSGLYRVEPDGGAQPIVAGTNLIGLAFDAGGHLVVTSNDTVYRFDAGFRL